MGLDHDEELERMCPKCREEATSHDKCSRCGKALSDGFVNPNFDKSKFEQLKNEDESTVVNNNFDKDRFRELE